MLPLTVIAAVAVVIGVAVALSYNRFVSQSKAIQRMWGSVETQLGSRYDLVPNLVATVQEYAPHGLGVFAEGYSPQELGVFAEVARTRVVAQAAHGAAACSATEGPFAAAVACLIRVAENDPELKAYQNFRLLRLTLIITEDRIRQSRNLYNAGVQQFNRRVQRFPTNLVAGAFHVRSADLFHIDDAERAAGKPPDERSTPPLAPS